MADEETLTPEWRELYDASRKTIVRFLQNPTDEKAQIQAARTATATLGAVTRHEQTQGAREQTAFMMARELATNNEQLAEYLRASMPSAPVLKALPKKTQ